MKKTTDSKLTPSTLRLILSGIMIAIVIASVGGVVLYRNFIQEYANQVSEANKDASIGEADVQKLQDLDRRLKENHTAVERAKNVVASEKDHEYQPSIITTLNFYAAKAGIEVQGYNFPDSEVGVAAPVPGTVGTQPGTIPVVGAKKVAATINIENPVNFTALMKFLGYVEKNLTKIQVNGVSMQRDDSIPNSVQVSPLNIEVYVR